MITLKSTKCSSYCILLVGKVDDFSWVFVTLARNHESLVPLSVDVLRLNCELCWVSKTVTVSGREIWGFEGARTTKPWSLSSISRTPLAVTGGTLQTQRHFSQWSFIGHIIWSGEMRRKSVYSYAHPSKTINSCWKSSWMLIFHYKHQSELQQEGFFHTVKPSVWHQAFTQPMKAKTVTSK